MTVQPLVTPSSPPEAVLTVPGAGRGSKGSRRRPVRRPRYVVSTVLLTVGVAILFALFFVWPGALGVMYSFTSYRGFGDIEFVGLDNYTALAQDPVFYAAVGRTLVYALFSVPFACGLSLLMAVALNNARAKGKIGARIIFFLPWLVSPIVAGVIWRWMFGESFGFVNFAITSLGGGAVPWSSNADLSLFVVILASAWGGAAFNMLLFIAALNNVPVSQYEAAELDGANPWQRFVSITLPGIAPTTLLVVLLSTLGHMKEFAMIQALNNGGPGTENQLIVQYIFQTGFAQSNVGYASAASMVLLVILLIIAAIQLAISKRSQAW
ncbi:carbohydrate ABC transporter permease [Rathayibacter sp. VKM Ac-2857]|uniref:carbohydrate ABC transporter permease n=1 Tax=Rathayibacter sp. VKM Ac-2857 TaxID=2739020 RepID=UPI00156713C1|nr:sugar ABC transporter permease [Rathayibacter sp. VKM Ac-2857]NQX14289.1 sugar ABC transporter permease [Rathayibacter sp. VKM Ac-2857]